MPATRTQEKHRIKPAVAVGKSSGGWFWWAAVSGAALLLGVIVGAAVVFSGRGGTSAAQGFPAAPRTDSQGRTTAPPWPAPTDVAAAVQAAGLPMLGEEGAVAHFHAHLDVIVDGRPVPVPAGIGVDTLNQRISPLHTHENDAVIHVESPVQARFTLGQFLTQWQVSAGADHLGGLRAGGDRLFRAYVDGRPVTGDPSAIVLAEHQEIALVYGTAAQHAAPPSSYAFPAGE